MILNLGVIDIPYSGAATERRTAKVASGTQTTGDVAGWLETKYGVMSVFAEAHEDAIVDAITDSMQGALESMMMGAPAQPDPFGSGMGRIEQEFRTFLDTAEIEGMGIEGVPTRAAIEGVSHRFKSKRAGRRPSFIDTGLYQTSFRAWID